MGIFSERRARCGRTLFAVLALVANLFAISVPLVHALAHEHAHEEGRTGAHEHERAGHPAPSGHDEEHDEIHPTSLHDECLIVPRVGHDLAAGLVPESGNEPVALLVVAEAPFVESSALHSRAPPRTAPARAPPLA
jgi:hypothetical protein